MKNKANIFYTAGILLITFLYLLPVLEYLVLLAINLKPKLDFYFFPLTKFHSQGNIKSLIGSFLLPLFVIILIELTLILFKKTPPGKVRLSLIQIALISSGYLIFEIFYLAFSVVVESISTNLEETFMLLGIVFPYNFFIIILIIASFFIYINRVTRITKQYIN